MCASDRVGLGVGVSCRRSVLKTKKDFNCLFKFERPARALTSARLGLWEGRREGLVDQKWFFCIQILEFGPGTTCFLSFCLFSLDFAHVFFSIFSLLSVFVVVHFFSFLFHKFIFFFPNMFSICLFISCHLFSCLSDFLLTSISSVFLNPAFLFDF